MHPSETVFCLLRDDPIRTIVWHPDSALREVCVVGRASVDMTGYIAAALRCFLDPRDRYGVYVLLAGHWQLVASCEQHQRSGGEIAEHAYSALASCTAAMAASAVARASFAFSRSTNADFCTAESTSASG